MSSIVLHRIAVMHDPGETLRRELHQSQPFRSRAQEATIAILRTADAVRRRISAAVEPEGITLQQYNVLRILRGARGQPMPTLKIAERLIEQAPCVTRLLDRLEAKGLVRRERCTEDRRQVLCSITDEGLRLLERLDGPLDEADEALTRQLDPSELETLLRMLERVRTGC